MPARLNYNHLRYFWAVAHNGNLTRTAEQLHVSQSALSLQIRKLEEQLRHDLFERKGKQLVLTEAGQIALDHADVIFGAGEELLSTLREEARCREVLRIGVLSTLSRNFQLEFLTPALGRPDVDLVVRSGPLAALLADLERHEIDVALTNVAPPRDSGSPWIIHRLAEQQVALVGHPERLVSGQLLEAALAAHPIVLPTVEAPIRAGFDALLDRLGITPHIAAEVDDMALLRLLARENRGLAVVPPIVVRDELETGRLVEAFQLPDLNESFFAITRSRRFPNRVLRELVEAARRGFAES